MCEHKLCVYMSPYVYTTYVHMHMHICIFQASNTTCVYKGCIRGLKYNVCVHMHIQ